MFITAEFFYYTMNESITCHYEGCYHPIVGMCEHCKQNFCGTHLKEESFITADGKKQYGKYCVDCLKLIKQTGNRSNPTHPFRPLFYITTAIVIIVVIAVKYL